MAGEISAFSGKAPGGAQKSGTRRQMAPGAASEKGYALIFQLFRPQMGGNARAA